MSPLKYALESDHISSVWASRRCVSPSRKDVTWRYDPGASSTPVKYSRSQALCSTLTTCENTVSMLVFGLASWPESTAYPTSSPTGWSRRDWARAAGAAAKRTAQAASGQKAHGASGM